MSWKKKILIALCVVVLFVAYQVWDWKTNRHWIGTTKETEIVQQYLLPMEEYFPEGDWHVQCGDSPEDYFMVWTDFGLFGTHPTLRSGICGATSDIVVEDNGKYINTKIIPWLKKQGFSEAVIEGDVDGDDFNFLEIPKKMVDISAKNQEHNSGGDKIQISFYIYSRNNSFSESQSDKVMIHIHLVYRYISSHS